MIIYGILPQDMSFIDKEKGYVCGILDSKQYEQTTIRKLPKAYYAWKT